MKPPSQLPQKPSIRVLAGDKGIVNITRNGKKEVVFKTKNSRALKHKLERLLPQDYFEFVQTYDLEDYPSLKDWVFNVIQFEPGLSNYFSLVEA